MAITAWSEGHRVLYPWEKFNEERLSALLRDNRIYCSNPVLFNDPWDCKPHFNMEILNDLAERQKHAQWAIDLCQRKSPMPPEAQERMRQTFLHNPAAAAKLINQLSGEMAGSIDEQYRVHCLGPDPKNLLMWSHYADSHRGICLEFSLTWARNSITCWRRRRRPGSAGAEVSMCPPRMRWTASCPCRTIRWVVTVGSKLHEATGHQR